MYNPEDAHGMKVWLLRKLKVEFVEASEWRWFKSCKFPVTQCSISKLTKQPATSKVILVYMYTIIMGHCMQTRVLGEFF